LASQLAQLDRQARQAARYRAIGEELRKAEGMLLYRRWREADEARLLAEEELRSRVTAAAQAETLARQAAKDRQAKDDALPPLREEEAIAAAVLQRLEVQRDSLRDQESQALQTIETLKNRILQLAKDIEREAGLNRDAGETIDRLEWEARELKKASEGHEDRLETAADDAHEAATILQDREARLSELTEDVARLAARHQSAQRLVTDNRATAEKSETAAAQAKQAAQAAQSALAQSSEEFTEAETAQAQAQAAAEAADEALAAADDARGEIQARESTARAARSEAEGEAGALRAEVGALARLVELESAGGTQLLDRGRVDKGYEAALGAALADDLRAPEVSGDEATGWQGLAGYARHASPDSRGRAAVRSC